MAQDPQDMMMTLLAGMGLTKLPSILKGLRGQAPAPLPETGADPTGLPQLANPELMAVVAQLMGAGGQELPGPPPAPNVPRWPAARSRPLIPRVANMSSALGL